MALVGRTTPEVVTERDATVQTYRLMRKNIEVAEFRWDPRANKVLKPCRAISMESMPFGCLMSKVLRSSISIRHVVFFVD